MIRMKQFWQLLALASPGGAGRNKTLNRQDFLRFEIYIPPLVEQRSVAELLSALDRRSKLLARYVNCLVAQRDALASQLLTGNLRVPDTEQIIAALAAR